MSSPASPRTQLTGSTICCPAPGTQGGESARRGGLAVQVNKIRHVQTITRVARLLGEDEDWLWDVATEMDQEDGLIWGHGPGEETVMAFTDFGIETLTDLVQIHKSNPGLLKRWAAPE